MKTSILIGWIIAAAALSGAELPENGGFESWNGAVPAKWQVNSSFKGGSLENRGGAAAITADKQPFALMADKFTAAKAGDQVTISIRYRGKGRFSAGLYCYDDKGVWVGKNLDELTAVLDAPDWTEFRQQLTLPALTHPKTGAALGKIRPMLTVAPGGSFEFDDYAITFGTAPAAVEAAPTVPAAPAAVKALPAKPGASSALQLPKRIYAVEGEECNIYFANLVNDRKGNFDVVAPLGRLDEKRWRLVPGATQAGVHQVTVRVLDDAGNLLDSATAELVVSKAGATARPLAVLVIGDSLTDNPTYPKHLMELLRKGGYTVKMIGSHAGGGRTPEPGGVAAEGRGGWTFDNYLTRNTQGGDYRARSPFLNAAGELDFKGYFAKYNDGKAPDVITFFLGCNDIAGAQPETLDAAIAKALAAADKLIAAAREAAPDALIGVAILPPPAASQDAFGSNYGTKIKRHQYLRNRRALVDAMLAKFEGDPRVSVIPTHLNLDCENHYPATVEPVSAGSAKTVRRLNNGVHPDEEGYHQIADTIYAWIRANIP